MPINNNLKKKDFPMRLKFDKSPYTYYQNNLESIDVKLIMAPKYEDVRTGCIAFANATWADRPWNKNEINKYMSEKTQDKFMYHIFSKKILPTTMETIQLTFKISGISLQEVTHILRYRNATFSAECSGDKFLHDKGFLIPTSIENSKEFDERYVKICEDAKALYCDMVETKEINIHDARYIMPRCLETFYFMSMDLKTALQFIYDRVDKQIQPQTDNVLAYQMISALCIQYPILVKIIGKDFIHRKADFYINTARQFRSTNWYCPDKDSDVFEYNEEDFIYGDKRRDEMLGLCDVLYPSNVFKFILEDLEKFLVNLEKHIDSKYGKDFFKEDLTKEDIGWCYNI
jgi:thymidylate synthase (FAD)